MKLGMSLKKFPWLQRTIKETDVVSPKVHPSRSRPLSNTIALSLWHTHRRYLSLIQSPTHVPFLCLALSHAYYLSPIPCLSLSSTHQPFCCSISHSTFGANIFLLLLSVVGCVRRFQNFLSLRRRENLSRVTRFSWSASLRRSRNTRCQKKRKNIFSALVPSFRQTASPHFQPDNEGILNGPKDRVGRTNFCVIWCLCVLIRNTVVMVPATFVQHTGLAFITWILLMKGRSEPFFFFIPMARFCPLFLYFPLFYTVDCK